MSVDTIKTATRESVRRHYAAYVRSGGDGPSVWSGRASTLGYDYDFVSKRNDDDDDCGDGGIGGRLEGINRLERLFESSCGSGCPLRIISDDDDDDEAGLGGAPPPPPKTTAANNNKKNPHCVRPGDTVVDFGCGAGHDVVLASRMVGPKGKVIGIDLTEEMIEAARRNAVEFGCRNRSDADGDDGGGGVCCGSNVMLIRAAIDDDLFDDENDKDGGGERRRGEFIPGLEPESADFVISNGVFNLCHDKRAAFYNAYRLLKPGGRLLLSDLCLVEENTDVAFKASCSVGDGWSS